MPLATDRRMWDLLMVLTAPPHVDDSLTTVLRLSRAMVDTGRTVRVWACGYNTMLTQETLKPVKPVNLLDTGVSYPSAAGVIGDMIETHQGRFGWIVCTACSAERGAGRHIEQVRLRSDARLAATITAARRTLYIGGA
jgi:sulfur relay (sulfurtransferase) complex TusBCD TusD component (DsrE family)